VTGGLMGTVTVRYIVADVDDSVYRQNMGFSRK
jgi:hypothetical protein